MNRQALLLTSALIALGGANVSFAQEAEEGASRRTLDTIVVTAQKREQNAQDVPVSITAISGQDLVSLGITESEDLGQFIPGLEINTPSGEGSQLVVFLRGAGLNDFNTNNAGPIGIYSDEVYISSPALTSFQLFDLDRVEVLKGPQGTLYGRNTTGGAIKFITNKPGDEFELNLRGAYESFGTTTFEGAVSIPFSDRVRARIAAQKVDSDGYVTNLVDGSDQNGTDTFFWRGTVDVDLTDAFSIRGNIHGGNVSSPGVAYFHVGTDPGGVDALGYSGPEDVFEGNYNDRRDIDIDAIGGYVEASLDLGGVTITSISAYDEVDRILPEETDSSDLDLLFIEFNVESETFTQELRVSGSTSTTEWLLGAYYLTEDLVQNQTIDLFRELRAFTGGVSDPLGTVTGAPILFGRSVNTQEIESFAFFGQVTHALTDSLNFTGGLRYTDEKRTFDAVNSLEDEALFGPGGLPTIVSGPLETDADALSWRVGLDFSPNENILTYASVARGFKAGGFNGGFLSLDPAEAAIQLEPIAPEFLTAYEIGIKSDLFENNLRLNAALFYNDFSDLQIFTQDNTGTVPVLVLDNAGEAEVYGFEFDATAYPVDGLLFNLNAAFISSELSEFSTSSGGNFDGNEVVLTPNTSISGIARYERPIGNIGLGYIQGSFSYKSDFFFSAENDPLIAQDGYTLVNARIGFVHDSGVGIAVFATNLTDKEYLVNRADLRDFGFFQDQYGPPRAFGVELTGRF